MLNQLTISELSARLAKREVSSRETVQACIDRIEKVDSKIHAFLSYDEKDAFAQADVADKGEPGRTDTFRLQLSNGYSAAGTLDGGNIQLHKPCA